MAQVANDQPPHPAIAFITALFGSNTEQPIFLQTLANDPGDLDEANNKKRLLTRDVAPIVKFIGSHDRNRRGMFFCVATVARGSSTRNKETVRETIGLHADIDFKGVVEDEAAIRAQLAKLRCQPTVIVRSGGGLHLYWCFKESLDTQEYLDLIEGALRRLADIVAGDLAVCEVARLMRLPGTHNSKYGDMREVVCERLDGLRYELDELEEWMSEQQPVLTRKPPEPKPGVKAEPEDDNPYLKHAREWGYKPRLDVEATLADMADGNIHTSLLRSSASLIKRGRNPEDVMAILMEASRQKGAPNWNWREQEEEIRGMIATALEKYPPKKPEVSRETKDEPPSEIVIDFDEARERKNSQAKPKPKPRGPNALLAPFIVADGVIETLRRHGADILLSEGDIWLYGDGFWRIMTPADQQWLLTEIQTGFEALGEPAKTSALHSSWKRLNEHPRLFKAKVPWADEGMIVCRNGVFRIETGHFEGHRPENYARRHIGTEYSAGVDCPHFKQLIANMFSDRSDADVVIGLVQEWAGAALAISRMTREERRALILVGPSRTGKTELARIFALLFGDPIATPSVAEISDPKFGLSPFLGATAWVRDDAINEGDKLDPQRFKTIVTGERIDIQKKRKDIVSGVQLNIPVLLTANTLPRARDGSDAIFNRSIILTMSNVIDEVTAHRIRLGIGGNGLSIGGSIFEMEGPGILNWALEGLHRLMARGFYAIPESVSIAIRQFKDDNNPVGEWAREAVEADPWSKVERRDLVRSYNGWELELEGDEARAHGGRWLFPKLRSQIKGLGTAQGHGGRRYITGVKLTAIGLAMWENYGKASPRNGPGGYALTQGEVNQINGEEMHPDHNSSRIEDTF
jgi:P4 family phage/plasmid primase-like protien